VSVVKTCHSKKWAANSF